MIEVVEAGWLTSVQDPLGRPGWRHLGVPVGGAADAWSARLANRLVGNPDDAAVVEMTMHGPTLRFAASATVAMTGRLDASADGMPLPASTGRRVRAGALLRVGAGTGARGWLAVGGGIAVASVLGSRSTDLRAAFGGHEGRALRAGDPLAVGPASPGGMARWLGRQHAVVPIRVVPGPDPGDLLAALEARTHRVSPEADRAGLRLVDALSGGAEVPSMGLPLGAIQVPPDGRPIVMLADRPVTGGYRVPAVVIGADVGRVAQLRPGDEVRFVSVSIDAAREAWSRAEDELAALEPLRERENDELGWTGSHR
jgi:biotin-dependent carboxylase-like uncharacterized protein